MTPERGRRLAAALVAGVPLLVLVASYGLLAVRHDAWNLFPVIVHESGLYTLLGTIFYFRHVVRELPVNLFAAMAIAAGAVLNTPAAPPSPFDDREAQRLRRWIGFGLSVSIAALLITVFRTLGGRETARELLQYHTRDDVSNYGSHWRYHLLHLIDTLLFSFGSAMALRGLTGRGPQQIRAVRSMVWWLAAFLAVTLIFGAPLQALTDPLNLAHEAREIETHRLLTIWPALGVVWLVDRRLTGRIEMPVDMRLVARGAMWIVAATVIPAGIAYRLRHTDLVSLAGRQSDLIELAASHHFEHVLDSFLIAGAVTWLYLRMIESLRRPLQPRSTR
jgi:hypothetical protein